MEPKAPTLDALSAYQFAVRARNKLWTAACRPVFGQLGRGTVLHLPTRIAGARRLHLGHYVVVGAGSWLEAGDEGRIELHDGVRLTSRCTITSQRSVIIERDVLIAAGVYISDHSHERGDAVVPIGLQGTTAAEPVLIKSGAWLGQNVVVLPGVTIGRNAVIGANSVVRDDVPDLAVAVGAPARVIDTRAAQQS